MLAVWRQIGQVFQTQRKASAEVWKQELDPLGGRQVFQHGWERLQRVMCDWTGGHGKGEKSQMPSSGEEWLRDLDRTCGLKEVTLMDPEPLASWQLCVFSGP